MIQKLKDVGGSLIDEVTGSKPLPPASVQSFLKNNNDTQFPALVITDHKADYSNKLVVWTKNLNFKTK